MEDNTKANIIAIFIELVGNGCSTPLVLSTAVFFLVRQHCYSSVIILVAIHGRLINFLGF
ncbi:MAG: hypothetical protein M3247_08595 [Thermoproteota archaeon]|jgi:hypothetical protein|nr:hypothetical protein [Thermoproteota archaeon]